MKPLLLLLCSFFAYTMCLGQEQKFSDQLDSLLACYDNNSDHCLDLEQAYVDDLFRLPTDTFSTDQIRRLAFFRRRRGLLDSLNMRLLDEAVARSVSMKDPTRVLLAYEVKCAQHNSLGDTQASLQSANDAMKIGQQYQDTFIQGRARTLIGVAHNVSGNYNKALEFLLAARSDFESIQDTFGLRGAISKLAGVYYYTEQLGKAQEMYSEAAELCLAQGDSNAYASALTNMANISMEGGVAEKALEALPKAIAILEQSYPIANTYSVTQYGRAKVLNGEISEGIALFKEGAAFCAKNNMKSQEAYNYTQIAEAFIIANDGKNAVKYGKQATALHKELGVNREFAETLEIYAKALAKNKDYDLAYENLNTYTALKDSLLNEERVKEFEALREKYEAEKREKDLALAAQKLQIAEQENSAAKTRLFTAIVGLVLLALLAFAIIGRQRARNREKDATIKLKTKQNETLTMEIDYKNRELTSQSLHLAQKNQMLKELEESISDLPKTEENEQQMRDLRHRFKLEEQLDKNWDTFIRGFNEVHPNFFESLKRTFPSITKNDLRYCALIKMNLSNKEVANILNISSDGVKKARQRLSKKMELNSAAELENTILDI